MENVRKWIEKSLNAGKNDLSPSKEKQFTESFELYLKSQGIQLGENGETILILPRMLSFCFDFFSYSRRPLHYSHGCWL